MLYFQSKKENVMEYKNGELDNKIISLMNNDVLVAKGRVIKGNTAGIHLDEVGFIEEGKGVKNLYSHVDLVKYRILVNS